ncbi:AraC family transcriptional regulator [Leisingera sp. NJS204]|uniref:AraC family transcriptional regulator n=1 Tax=Leisingera sp. NJS204 TaxID=2508307 RepID=UPI0010134A94|nr:AraC family transcriptional regulator [Leisingera sp. NJS204]QAX28750.1 AraC family transcriptional regulator [Leisingera sp. NJS204]
MNRATQTGAAIGKGEFLISADYLGLLISFSAKYGVSPESLFSNSDVSLTDYLSRPLFVRSDTYNGLIDELVGASRDPLLPWKYGKAISELSHGAVGLALQSCATLQQFFDLLPMFFATRAGYAQSVSVRVAKTRCEIVVRSSKPDAPGHIVRFNTIASLMAFAWMSRRLTGTETGFLDEELQISWPDPGLEIPADLLPPGTTVSFEQRENLISLPKTRLHTRIVSSSPSLMDAALRRCEVEMEAPPPNSGVVEKVQWMFRKTEPELPTLEATASRLGVSPATLKRQLNSQGTSFIKIKKQVRFDRVTGHLLLGNLSIDQIAVRTGFSDASNLSKAFRQYFGETPGQFRERHRLLD